MFIPRPKQAEILKYKTGTMGVSAVPGSGKTHILSYLAAELVANVPLEDDQEVLIVTLVKSAVGNFSQRIRTFLEEKGLIPNIGYSVRTLHGMANDITRERAVHLGVDPAFEIVDDQAAQVILRNSIAGWLKNDDGTTFDAYISEQIASKSYKLKGQLAKWQDTVVPAIAKNFIKTAKDRGLTPQDLRQIAAATNTQAMLLFNMGVDIYTEYQRGLAYRGALDYDDLMHYALIALKDAEYLRFCQHRWPYILEDEAQDSSRIQEDILRKLCGENGNWIRVGDPNQAIYETFTTANPKYLRDFLIEADTSRDLPNSGRSTQDILSLANRLIDWVNAGGAGNEARSALVQPYIEPTSPEDPQPNPTCSPTGINFVDRAFSVDEEQKYVVEKAASIVEQHPDQSVAILVFSNAEGSSFAKALRDRQIKYAELLKTTSETRSVAKMLANLFTFLLSPTSSKNLKQAFLVWGRDLFRASDALQKEICSVASILGSCKNVEDFLWPLPENDWLVQTISSSDDPAPLEHLREFRTSAREWLMSSFLPVDQLIIAMSQTLFSTNSDRTAAYKMAVALRQLVDADPDLRLGDLKDELMSIGENGKRQFVGIDEIAEEYNPDNHKGEVTVATMHKAKGLEWDHVFIVGANSYVFPTNPAGFSYKTWAYRQNLDPSVEAIAQLNSVVDGSPYVEGVATHNSNIEAIAERCRLLFVGITRARTGLTISWNKGALPNRPNPAADAFTALANFQNHSDKENI